MKKSIKNEKGITLVSVVIIVIVLIILASIATVSGISTVKFAQYTAFKTELQLLQNEVNALKQDKSNDELLAYGVEMTDSQKDIFSVNEISSVLNGKEGDINTIENDFRYFSQEYLTKNLGIDGITKDYYINLKERIIIATEPVTYEDVDYYMLEQIENGGYNVQYNNQIGELTFEATGEPTNDGGKIIISNVNYTGYIDKWEVQYRLQGDENWKDAGEFTGSTYTFEVTQSGTYEVRLKHGDEVQSELLTAEVIDSIYIVSNEQRQVTNNGYTAQIPSGFAVVPECISIADGLVISNVSNDINNEGNQYVWIPCAIDGANGTLQYKREETKWHIDVDNGTSATRDELTLLGEDVQYSEGDLANGVNEEIAQEIINQINAEKASVEKNGGFYIGRYEVGKENNEAVIKQNKEPYTGVKWIDAYNLAKKIEVGSEVTSYLCSSYAWDTALSFIESKPDSSDYGSNISRYNGNWLNKDVLDKEGKVIKEAGLAQRLNTGLTTPVCNIYDMGGNVGEFTTELNPILDETVVLRGAHYKYDVPAGERWDYSSMTSGDSYGFRATLFLK